MQKLMLRPNSSGYSVTSGNEIVSAQTAGGPSRSRRDFLGAPSVVNVAWMLDELGFEYLNAFFRGVTEKGALPFLCDLLLERAFLQEYTCKFVPGSFKPVSSTAAFTFNATAQFEVLPLPDNDYLDASIVAYFEYSGGSFTIANRLSHSVNVVAPEELA